MASHSPLPLALSIGRSQFTLTFPKQMEGGAGKRLVLKEEISAVQSHKIPRACELTLQGNEWQKQKVVRSV